MVLVHYRSGLAPSAAGLSIPFDYLLTIACRGPTTPDLVWFGLFRFRSPLLSESLVYFLFLQVLRCFNSLGFLLISYVLAYG